MTDYLLVVGDVTDEQYAQALKDMVQHKLMPVVLRLTLGQVDVIGIGAGRFREFLDKGLLWWPRNQPIPLASIRGLVMPASLRDDPTYMFYAYKEKLALVTCWVVHPDGTIEYI